MWTKLWQRGRAMPTTLRCSLRRRCTMHDAMAAVMEAGSTLSQWRVLIPMQEFDVPASIAVDALSAGRAARRAGRPRAFRKQGAAEGINCQGCNTTATTICDNGRAAARSRREEPCEPDETTTRRHRVLAAMADEISASPHAARGNRLDGIGAAAAPLSSQRVSHENCQVNALAVVAPAALATAVYDAALATSLAASLAAALASAALPA